MTLAQQTADARCIAIIGMEKNAGKTTVLNYLLSSFADRRCAISSIGYDGELIDQVGQTRKPSIYIGSGTLVATAATLLAYCDFTREIMQFTRINTPMGEVAIVKARSDGFVRLAGPSITAQMDTICKIFAGIGAEKIFIDGAAARKSTAAINSADACILVTGASLSPSVAKIAESTAFIAELLSLKSSESDLVRKQFEHLSSANELTDSGFSECMVLTQMNELVRLGSSLDEQTAIMAAKFENPRAFIFKGAMTRGFAKKFLVNSKKLNGLEIVARDGSRFLLTKTQYRDFLCRGARFRVFKPAGLRAITINPIAPGKYRIDSERLRVMLEKLVDVPVYDVMCDERALAA
jgi:hypothetical protein